MAGMNESKRCKFCRISGVHPASELSSWPQDVYFEIYEPIPNGAPTFAADEGGGRACRFRVREERWHRDIQGGNMKAMVGGWNGRMVWFGHCSGPEICCLTGPFFTKENRPVTCRPSSKNWMIVMIYIVFQSRASVL